MYKLNFTTDFQHWTTSYLYDLKHFVQINTDVSTFLYSSFRVPQGSILGPILFNLCVVDRSSTVKNCECLQYADDTMIYHYHKVKSIRKPKIILERELSHLLKWSKETNLVLNPSKTKLMIIGTKQMARVNDLENKSNEVNPTKNQ